MSATKGGNPQILHLFTSFDEGEGQARAVRLMNAFGSGPRHAIVPADPGALGAGSAISRSVSASYPKDFPSLRGRATPGRLQRLARALKGYDLVLTYGWGAMDAAMAHTLFSQAFGLPPLIHHEDGFGRDEARRLKRSRNFYRKLALGRASGLVVPSEALEEVALETWDQPMGRVKRIVPGIESRPYTKRPKRDALRGVVKHHGEFWVGLRADLLPEESLDELLAAFAPLPDEWQLVIVGEGPEREALRDEADRLGVGHRLHLPGNVADPARFTGLFDIYAMTSPVAQFPVRVLEAMAAGLPMAGFAAGDLAQMVCEQNAEFLVPVGKGTEFAAALSTLARDDGLRDRLGDANREKVRAEFPEKPMIDAHRRLYASAMGRETLG